MIYAFLVETYRTEIEKVLSAWAMFDDAHLGERPHAADVRGRSLREQMVHQCISENLWFMDILGIAVTEDPLPEQETRNGFMRQYAMDAEKRLAELRTKDEAWWAQETDFFGEPRSRAWVLVRRIAHTAHHRGQQTALLRMLNRDLHSTYGPTADTGGLMQNHAPTLYAYANIDTLLEEESGARNKTPLPGPGANPVTERPDQ